VKGTQKNGNQTKRLTAFRQRTGRVFPPAYCHLGLGRLYRRMDKREQAQEHLATARAMYGGMGMTYWLEKLEKGMSALE
jgi:hypothetical protein